MLASITELSFVWAGFLAALTSCFVTSVGVILADLLLSGRYKFDSINTVSLQQMIQFLYIPTKILFSFFAGVPHDSLLVFLPSSICYTF